MIRNNNLGALMGAPVLGKDEERIGTVGQIFVDPATDMPNWMTVHTGLFGRHETFVPLQDAEWDHERVHVDIDKETIKAAPRIGTDEALSPEDEQNLYRYYAVSAARGDADAGRDADDDRDPDAGRGPDPDREATADRPGIDRAVGSGRLKRFVAEEDPRQPGDGERHAPRHAKTD